MKVLITGSDDGIGLATAQALAQDNHKITLVARNEAKLKDASASLTGSGHKIIVADLSVKEDVDAIKSNIDSEQYDIFINNAGVGMFGNFAELSLSKQVKMMNLNMTALTALSYFYLNQAKKGDVLVNIASVVGISSYPGAAVYAATKSYIVSLSQSLWREYKKRDIYVLGFCPGSTNTNFFKIAGSSKDNYSRFITQTPAQVARELIRAVEKRKKPVIVSGYVNRIMILIQKVMTRRMITNMMATSGALKEK